MGEEDTGTRVAEAVANGTATTEHNCEDVSRKKEKEADGVEENEEDGKDDDKGGTQKMDVDPELNVNDKKDAEEEMTKEEDNLDKRSEAMEEVMEKENEVCEEKEDELNMEEEALEEVMKKENEETEEKIEEEVELKEEKEGAEEVSQEKGSKKRGKGKTAGVKAQTGKNEVEEKDSKTPVASASGRPVRERKSVERLVVSIEDDSVKEFYIGKGCGTALKDIPNVAFKLSKRKTDDTLKFLHTIFFGRRAKAVQVKSNISQFSGFVRNENEEKQKIKVKEKLDKCMKEKLLECYDVLDIPFPKANTRKEDIVAVLIDFLVAPHATTTELLAGEEQSSKGKKRKRVVNQSASMSGSVSSELSAKSRRKIESTSKEREKNNALETEDESGEEEEANAKGLPKKSRILEPKNSKSQESRDEFEKDPGKDKSCSKKSFSKKGSAGKTKSVTPKKSSPPTKKKTRKSSSRSKVDDSSDTSPKTFSRKKRSEVVNEKSSTPKQPASIEKSGKKVVKGNGNSKEENLRPRDAELKNAICEILKEVDFNTATFTDILKQLAGQFKTDLTPRKSSIKAMIQDELARLADEEEDEEDMEA